MKIKVSTTNKTILGILEYHDDKDIICLSSNNKLSKIPPCLIPEESFAKNEFIKKLNLSGKTQNQINWAILSDIAQRKSGFKGYNFEQL